MHQIFIQCKHLFKWLHVWAFFQSYNYQWWVWIFKYIYIFLNSAKILFAFVPFPKYKYSDILLVKMWHPNIFGYSLVNYVASENIWIFSGSNLQYSLITVLNYCIKKKVTSETCHNFFFFFGARPWRFCY